MKKALFSFVILFCCGIGFLQAQTIEVRLPVYFLTSEVYDISPSGGTTSSIIRFTFTNSIVTQSYLQQELGSKLKPFGLIEYSQVRPPSPGKDGQGEFVVRFSTNTTSATRSLYIVGYGMNGRSATIRQYAQ